MSTLASHYFASSIGRKHLIALTGLGLCGFLVGHLSGNFLLLIGSDAFNIYAHKLASLGVGLYVIEAGLAGIFLLHLGLAIKLTIENKQARSQKYYVKTRTGRGETIFSASMPYTGVILLIFIITHLMGLKFGTYYETTVDGVLMRDMYRTTMENFQSAAMTGWYALAMICAAFHTAHGVSSALQSLGINHARWTPKFKLLGLLYAIAVGGGFTFLAIWAHLKGV